MKKPSNFTFILIGVAAAAIVAFGIFTYTGYKAKPGEFMRRFGGELQAK
jgi:hypothetical protein